jgi:small redox-active disulfide protein 2
MNNKINSIQVLGSGCSTCKQLFEATKKVVEELKMDMSVDYITDVTKMIEMGVMQGPILAINGKPMITGSVPDIKKIKELITKEATETALENKPVCSCRSNC